MEKVIVDYQIVSNDDDDKLMYGVNALIKIGYQPYLNPFALTDSKTNSSYVYQAMVKYAS